MRRPIIIGIAGGSASGKTSIAQKIYENFEVSKSVVIIREDDYYKNQDNLTMAERLKTNYDHPFAFDHPLLLQQIQELIAGFSIDKPLYDYSAHTRSQKSERIDYSEVIILEGLFVLEDEELRNLLDIKIFVDTPADVRFIRRLIRDTQERGRTVENVIEQYLTTVRDMHESFVEPSKKYADIIVPEGVKNSVAMDLLITKIDSIISKNIAE